MLEKVILSKVIPHECIPSYLSFKVIFPTSFVPMLLLSPILVFHNK